MLSFNRNEKFIIVIISSSILFGSILHYYRIKNIDAKTPSAYGQFGNAVYHKAININTASEEDLNRLSGIGPSLAKEIILYREQHGSFRSIEEIMNIKGIGKKKFSAIKEAITTE